MIQLFNASRFRRLFVRSFVLTALAVTFSVLNAQTLPTAGRVNRDVSLPSPARDMRLVTSEPFSSDASMPDGIASQQMTIQLKNTSRVPSEHLGQLVAKNLCPAWVNAGVKTEVDVLCAGQRIQGADQERAILLVKDLPGVSAVGHFKPATAHTPSTLDLVVRAEKPVYSIGLDNYGSEATGKTRLNTSADFANLYGNGDQLSLGVSSAFTHGAMTGGASYSLPVGFSGMRAGMALARSHYRLGAGFTDSQGYGSSVVGSVFGHYPIIRAVNRSFYVRGVVESVALTDHFDSTVSTTQSTTQRAGTVVRLGVNGDNVDALAGGGYTSYNVAIASGKITSNQPDVVAADAAKAQSLGHFNKFSYSAARQQALAGALTLYAAVSGQSARQNLDASEQISITGPTAVRAYRADSQGRGSTGVVGTLELRYTVPMSLWETSSNLTYGVFTDRGWMKNNSSLGGTGLSAALQARRYYLRAASAVQGSSVQFWFQAGMNF